MVHFCLSSALFTFIYCSNAVWSIESSTADRPGPSACASCSARARQRSPQELQREKLRLEQEKILSKLRLQKPPNVHFSINDLPSPLIRQLKEESEQFERNLPKLDTFHALSHYTNGTKTGAMEELKRKRGEDDDRDDPLIAKTKGIYIFSQVPKTGDPFRLNCVDSEGRVAGCIELKLSSELFTRSITGASLWLYKTMEEGSSGNVTLEISEIQPIHSHQASYEERWLADAPMEDGYEGWLRVELTERVAHWRQNERRSKRLRIACATCSNSAHAPIDTTQSRSPFLEVKLGDQTSDKGRNRRSSNECSPHLYSNCCLKAFYVNFTEIGWNTWILQPPGYYANYCTGSCRMTATTSYTNIIRNVGNTKEARGEEVDKELVPCCAPTKMMSLSLLYVFSPGEIMKKTLENMIVESCGC